ncbi:unnamed protein product [Trichogramma brassicae]|uniref:MIF4G domain-containing protein n=1 Tax=Trichogramma brassicae TaxID=86971 RepID=A0A6H5ISM9_9HYME|nr:unnamed protein product [Trichogramma brassicae]
MAESINSESLETVSASGDVSDEDNKILSDYVKEAEARLANKEEMRASNTNFTRPPDSYFSKLDSNLKKNTTFVKKLKTFAASQLDNVMKDVTTLNLTKYISEVASALVEAKLKMTDIPAVLKICSYLHQKYADFSNHFFENWQKTLMFKNGDKIANPSKLRVDLRLYSELVASGIFTPKQGLPLLGSVLTFLINMDKEEHNNTNIILSFCKHCGEDYAGLVSKKIRELSEKMNVPLPTSNFLPTEKKQNVKTLLRDYYNSLCKHLYKDHKALQAFEKQNRKILQTRGELSSERKEKLEAFQISYDRLLNNTQLFSEILDEPMPELPVEIEAKTESENGVKKLSESSDSSILEDLWGDEETCRFYESLTDLSVFLPGSYKKVSPKKEVQSTEQEKQSLEINDDQEEDLTVLSPEELDKLEAEAMEREVEVEDTEEAQTQNVSNKILLDAFLNHLPNCVNREMIDNAAVDFVMTLNTKNNKKKLIKTLFGVSRIRLDLLPFYSRLAAILYPVMPEVGNDLCQMLKQDFKYHVHKKDQINIESKIKVVRYIGELVKFKLYSKAEALHCLKVLLYDFTHHHVDMACNLLETCGKFLFCSPDSHHRTKVYLEQMMRKRQVTSLDPRYVTLIENAYYSINPPESVTIVKKERPPLHEFIRKLLYQDLGRNTIDKVLQLMIKLDWHNKEVSDYAIRCFIAAHNVKYLNIRQVAYVLQGLASICDWIAPPVIDGVLEDIRINLEINQIKFNQRRIAMIKFLGELFNYRLIDHDDLFQVFYLLITFASSTDLSVICPLDPPDNLFRIRLVCTLMDTCASYIDSGSGKKKLDYYLVFFQHYYWSKFASFVWTTENPFPWSITSIYQDAIRKVRPNLTLYQSYQESLEAVIEVQKALFPNLAEMQEKKENVNDLEAIPEEDSDILPENEDVKSQPSEENSEETNEVTQTQSTRENTENNTPNNTQGQISPDDSDPSAPIDNSENEVALPVAPKLVSCQEDDDFLSALDKMVSDNIQDRMRETAKPQQVDISVPLNVKNTKKTYEQLQDTTTADTSTVDFVLMVRKGNKPQYKNVAVPVNSELAKNLKNREQELKEEKEKVKRLTLNITERQEEEDYQEAISQGTRPVTANLNRERRPKYNHPKGAPDADLIFGPKKIR